MTSSRKKPRFDPEQEDNNSQTTIHKTPIGMLSHDIFFYIFSINGPVAAEKKSARSHSLSQEEHGALTTIRYASQVCREWRRLLLSSPTIWANSLDIDELDQKKDEWRSEVMGRTGNATISIKLEDESRWNDPKHHSIPFVVDALRREWNRIASLYISTNNEKVVEQMLALMVQPAPQLEYLYFWTAQLGDGSHFLVKKRGMLFANKSPKLGFISCGGKTYLNFQHAPMALSNVRRLDLFDGWSLHGLFAAFSISQIYRALQHLPILEELMIRFMSLSGSRTPMGACISLPRLKEIIIPASMRGGPSPVTKLLGHIVPAQGCRLMTGKGDLNRLNSRDLLTTSEYYATFITAIADFRPVQSISFSYTQWGFEFRAADVHQSDWNYLEKTLPLTLAFSYDPRGVPLILERFSTPIIKAISSRTDFGCVTELELTLDETLISTCRLDLQTFFGSLISVTELIASVTTVQILMEIQTTADFVLLPSTTHFSLYGKPFEFTKVEMAAFLDARLNSGIPVKVLNLDLLKQHYSYSQDPQWEIFEQYDGLSVTWRSYTFEDECDYDES